MGREKRRKHSKQTHRNAYGYIDVTCANAYAIYWPKRIKDANVVYLSLAC